MDITALLNDLPPSVAKQLKKLIAGWEISYPIIMAMPDSFRKTVVRVINRIILDTLRVMNAYTKARDQRVHDLLCKYYNVSF